MEPLVFKKNSLHFKLAKMGGLPQLQYDLEQENICSYTKRVLLGALLAFVIVVLVTILAVLPGISLIYDILYWVGIISTTPSHVKIISAFNYALTTYAYILSIGIIGKMGAYIIDKLANRVPPEPKPDGFIANAYKSFKNKYCTKVEFR